MTQDGDRGEFLHWLRDIGLGRYADDFEKQQIDFDIAEDLRESDLSDIGISALGDRKRFMKALGARRSEASGPGTGNFPHGERRQITVLFADIAGYTKLSGALDAEELHSMLNGYFDVTDGVIREFGGSIDKHIGDAVMAVFGAPVAHTDDPLRAVLAALEIHRRLDELDEPIRVHVGIASGEVVAGGTGSDRYQEYTVTGSTVNLASRLDGLANPGETFVNDEVYSAVCDEVSGRAVGDMTVKGFDSPVTVWSIESARDASEQEQTVAICGRRSERDRFTDAASSCLKESSGRMFYLRGEPGIGKSCLAEAYFGIAGDLGFSCVKAMILDFGAATGREALRSVASDLIDPEGITAPEDMVGCAVKSGLVAGEHEIHLHDLLDIPLPVGVRAIYDAMDNETRRKGRHAALAALVLGACRQQPRFIWIDNLHWADAFTASMLLELVKAVRGHPLMLVFTTRIVGDPWAEDGFPGTAEADRIIVDLRALEADEALEMARTLGIADADLVERCRERAGGNPLFLEQLFRTASDGSDSGLPATVQSVILARMDGLDVDDRKALQAASVMGQRFSLDVLRVLTGQPDYTCGELIRRALVRPDGQHFLFVHALVADGVYKSLLNAQRSALHEKAAAWYSDRDAALHAQHLDRAGLPQAAGAYCTAAGLEAEA
jgi:class 3 adenylate cyclase